MSTCWYLSRFFPPRADCSSSRGNAPPNGSSPGPAVRTALLHPNLADIIWNWTSWPEDTTHFTSQTLTLISGRGGGGKTTEKKPPSLWLFNSKEKHMPGGSTAHLFFLKTKRQRSEGRNNTPTPVETAWEKRKEKKDSSRVCSGFWNFSVYFQVSCLDTRY